MNTPEADRVWERHPGPWDLEGLAETRLGAFKSVMDRRIQAGKPLIGYDLERMYPRTTEYLKLMTMLLVPSEYSRATPTARKAFHFSVTLGAELLGRDATIKPILYTQAIADIDDLAERTKSDSQSYLTVRPNVNRVLNEFRPSIVEQPEFTELARTIGGITLLQIELHQRREADIESEVRTFSQWLETL